MRVIVANFDAEIEMARGRTPGPHPDLPAAVRRRRAGAAAELAVLGGVVRGSAGELEAGEGIEALLGWAETDSIAAARRRLGLSPPAGAAVPRDLGDAAWLEALWSLGCAPEIVARCHDRGFWLEVAERRGDLLPGTERVESLAELERLVPALSARSLDGAWMAVAPLSAAGRERVHRWTPEIPGDIALRLERLIERYGWLLAAPWHRRDLDFGVAGLVGAAGPGCFAPHRQLVDRSGVFRGIEIDDDAGWLDAGQRCAVSAAAGAAGEALYAAGYRGPFGIDGFLYRDAAGAAKLAPMCEINARVTFGLVARARRSAASPGGPRRSMISS